MLRHIAVAATGCRIAGFGKAQDHPTTREPGDLPFARAIVPGTRGGKIPLACTEVVMAARTITKISSLGISQRLGAAGIAMALGAFLVWGAGLANSAVLHDTAHDTRHSYGFPCH
jgi:cobalt transporter subunit CbtB